MTDLTKLTTDELIKLEKQAFIDFGDLDKDNDEVIIILSNGDFIISKEVEKFKKDDDSAKKDVIETYVFGSAYPSGNVPIKTLI